MIKKIKKKIQKGPKATYAVPMAMVFTALYGPRREGKDFRQPLEQISEIREVLQRHLGQTLILADRPLSLAEYLSWGFKSRPSRLAEMFSGAGVLPMGPVTEEEPLERSPRLGIFPMIVLVQERELESFSDQLSEDLSEITRVAFQNAIYSALRLIPGYDLLLYSLPMPAQGLNHAIDSLNQQMQAAFEQAAVPFPGPFEPIPSSALEVIPLKEPCTK